MICGDAVICCICSLCSCFVNSSSYQMEESKKRRERLKAMQMEAADVEASNIADGSTPPGYLSNPRIEPSSVPLVEEAVPRFDFYTDPMAGSSGNKRWRSTMQTPQNYTSHTTSSGSPISRLPSSLSGSRNPNVTPTPAHQYHINYSPNSYSPNQRIYEASNFGGSDSWRSPVGSASPFHGHQGTPPGVWNRSAGRAGYSFPFHSPRGRSFSSPPPGWGGSHSPYSGRGSNHKFSNSPSFGSGRGGGRGRGLHAIASAHEKPYMFYNKTMLEDPWRLLTPVVRISVLPVSTQHTHDSPRSWLPNSLLKKARDSEAVNESNSQSSLAECLAASFEEAVNDATSI
ncbi:protein SICKLE-like isoform X1 [Macadamia integrifolia]|uniref:protein SICKLE-like isoform X1 n=1 Tax=Macadamia integrifolia TaxID=60698 RepID=UPI001C4F5D2F|nr:protein SICKLE-like isoform X1 [Macadamia integrifolia]